MNIHRGIHGKVRRAAGIFAALLLLLTVRPAAGQGIGAQAAPTATDA